MRKILFFSPSSIFHGGSAGALAQAMGGAPLARYGLSVNYLTLYRRKRVGPHRAPRGAHFPHKWGKE